MARKLNPGDRIDMADVCRRLVEAIHGVYADCGFVDENNVRFFLYQVVDGKFAEARGGELHDSKDSEAIVVHDQMSQQALIALAEKALAFAKQTDNKTLVDLDRGKLN